VRVLVAMSGGVDSSVAAALALDAGHDVVGATMKLWGGPSDSGCCSLDDVDDARAVAARLGIAHHVFNFTEDFERDVVDPYVADHAAGRTPNPCVACNRHLKFDRFARRAQQLGFDAIATGHHARVAYDAGRWRLRRGRDRAKDQSYVLHMLGQEQLAGLLLPVGEVTKAEVRAYASARDLRTAAKADSQDVCFISRRGGREAFLGERIELRPGEVRDRDGGLLGSVDAVELVTVGQRRGLGLPGGSGIDGERCYALDVDLPGRVVTVGPLAALLRSTIGVGRLSWVAGLPPPPGAEVAVQCSAHGDALPGRWWPGEGGAGGGGDEPTGRVELDRPQRRVAPGQSVVLYEGDDVLGGGSALT